MEIMIVIFLIGLIGSVIGYNMKGSIDEGRYFKSEQVAAQVREILLLEIAKGADIDLVVEKPEHYVKRTGLTKEAKKIMLDGWDQKVKVSKKGDFDIEVISEKGEEYRAKRMKNTKGEIQKKETDSDTEG